MCNFVAEFIYEFKPKNYFKMKKLFLTIMATAMYSAVFAGGMFTNTNQNVYFLRNPGRGASSTEIDAVYSNPAGLAFMQHEGFTLSLNNQSAWQTRTATTTFAPFAMNGGDATKEFKGEVSALFIPSVMAAYKWKNFVFSGAFAIVGGGGTIEFKNGLPMFEAQVAGSLFQPLTQLNGAATQAGYAGAPLGYSLNMNLEGTSITYGTQLGVTYKINELFSGFVGARASFVGNGYEGYLRDVMITNAEAVKTHFTDTADYLESLGQTAQAETIREAAAGVTNLQAGAAQTDIAIDLTQSGWGIAPILGLNFNYEKLNVGVKYDFNTNITLKNKTKVNTSGMPAFDDKVKSDYDIPALLTVGASYKFFNDKLTASAGYHLFFDKQADMTDAKQKHLANNSHELLAGLEYQICDRVLVSAGGQLTRIGLTDEFQSDLSFTSNSYSIGFGTQIKITEKLSANLAYFFTNYDDYTKDAPFGTASKTVYSRSNQTFGIGLDYKF